MNAQTAAHSERSGVGGTCDASIIVSIFSGPKHSHSLDNDRLSINLYRTHNPLAPITAITIPRFRGRGATSPAALALSSRVSTQRDAVRENRFRQNRDTIATASGDDRGRLARTADEILNGIAPSV